MEKNLVCPYCRKLRECKSIQDFDSDGKIGTWVWECKTCDGHFPNKTFVGKYGFGIVTSGLAMFGVFGDHGGGDVGAS